VTLRIKNWKKFQHYKNRKPPWIRLYNDLLDDPDFNELDGELVKTLVKIWLAASEHDVDGSLPDIRTLALKIHVASTLLATHINGLNHWVYDDCEHDASKLLASETETETETETEKRQHARARSSYSVEFETFRSSYPKHRLGGKAQDWKSWQTAKAAGMTVDKAEEYLGYWKKSPKWQRDNGSYIVALSRWLREGYWETIPADFEPRPETRAEAMRRRTVEALRQDQEDGKHGLFD
jgi:hypothetical protein